MSQSQRKNVFISYSHADKQWLERLNVHLKPLEREGLIDLWSDEKIQPSSNWKEEIRKALKEAKVAVLLISADFLASDFIHTNELPPLLAAAEKEDAHILPVIVSRSSFEENESLSKYQAVNPPNKPSLSMSRAEVEDVFYHLYKSILQILRGQEVTSSQKASIEPVEKMRPKEQISEIIVPKIKLRSRPIENLTKDAVEIMLKDKGFFDVNLNQSAPGFPHQYEVQKEGRVVYDHASGLMWQQSGSTKAMPYEKAKAFVEALNSQNIAGYSEWRLPTLEEAMSLMKPTKNKDGLYIDPLFDTKQWWIWTSDTYSASSAWVVNFGDGICYDDDFSRYYYVRAVR